ncbi:hypothetical protein ACDA63_07740 [Uliginosibacterium sp. sgz301328]|uniref:hypothetical protein n=1 Tax=Uliginosibacterium sp. sgz301328 TaxID=3243764 RepID=UPI00359D2AFD
MPANRPEPKEPLQILAEGAVVAAGMALTVLLLMRGKVLVALLMALLFAGILVRLKRAWQRRRATR